MVSLRPLCLLLQSVHRWSVETHAASIAASRPRLPTVPTNRLSRTLTGHQAGARQRVCRGQLGDLRQPCLKPACTHAWKHAPLCAWHVTAHVRMSGGATRVHVLLRTPTRPCLWRACTQRGGSRMRAGGGTHRAGACRAVCGAAPQQGSHAPAAGEPTPTPALRTRTC